MREAGIDEPVARFRAISNDAHQSVIKVELERGTRLIVKLVDATQRERLIAEHNGLLALSKSGHLLVPATHPVIDCQRHTLLIMEFFETPQLGGDTDWTRFGEALARHHLCDHGDRYGWAMDNFIGATPQPNTCCDDWIAFNAEHRLGFQLRLARDRGLLSGPETERVTKVIERLDRLIPARPHPALLHGDLWSGNIIPTLVGNKTHMGVIDPAVHVGDGWADIAMLRLFGSPPRAFEDAYASLNTDREQVTERVLVYQLYHALNHLNIFGSSYLGLVMRLTTQIA